MRFFDKPIPRHTRSINSFRDALARSKRSETLDSMPERFGAVIERFNSDNIDPRFRDDIFEVLDGAVSIAQSMVDSTFSVEEATLAISKQMDVLARALRFIQSTPVTRGYAILLPESNRLIGNFATETEALQQLSDYRALGISSTCQVVPTQVRSLHAIQPRDPYLSHTQPEMELSLPEFDNLPGAAQDAPMGEAPSGMLARLDHLDKDTDHLVSPVEPMKNA